VTRYGNNRLKGIGMVMLCSLLKNLRHFHGVSHVYLVATTTPDKLPKLISLYESFGFRSLDGKNMIAPVGLPLTDFKSKNPSPLIWQIKKTGKRIKI